MDMDELIAYLEKRFNENSRQIQELRQEMTQEISGLRQEVHQEISGLRQEMNEKLSGVQEEIRHAHVLIEGVDSELRLLAEGVVGVVERLDPMRADFTREIQDTRSLIQSSYVSLECRVHALETWRETKERDPIDIIRERFGKRPQT